MPNPYGVKIEGHYWLQERFRYERTEWIIKIKKLGEHLPQQIEGKLFNTKTGEFSITNGLSERDEPSRCVFACELEDEVAIQELKELKNKFPSEVYLFFGF